MGLLAVVTPLLALAIPASGQPARSKPSHKKPYKVIGHVSKKTLANEGGAWCFGAAWKGDGGWSYDSKTATQDGEYVDHENDQDSGHYSWDIDQGRHATSGLCRYAATLKPVGLFTFTNGSARTGWKVDDVTYEVGPGAAAPVTTSCASGAIKPASGLEAIAKANVSHSSITFSVTPDAAPISACGTVHPFTLEWDATSAAIPISTFDTAKEIVITISPRSRITPNCGIKSPDTTCSESGIWQGTLTLTRARNG
jgi:hypothetical protein